MVGRTPAPYSPTVSLEPLKTQHKLEQQGPLIAQTDQPMPNQTGRREEISFWHSHTPITVHLELKTPALQWPPQRSLMGRK